LEKEQPATYRFSPSMKSRVCASVPRAVGCQNVGTNQIEYYKKVCSAAARVLCPPYGYFCCLHFHDVHRFIFVLFPHKSYADLPTKSAFTIYIESICEELWRDHYAIDARPPHSINLGGTYACTRISEIPPLFGREHNMGIDDPPYVGNMDHFTTLF
jgi:hypothetical protein